MDSPHPLPASSRWALAAAFGCAVVAAAILLAGRGEDRSALDRARAAIRRQEWPQAVAILDDLERRRGPRGEIELARGRILRRQGLATEAERRFAAAESLGADPEQVRRQRLLATAQSGRIKLVERELTGLLVADADDDFAEDCYEAMTRGFVSSFRLDEAARCVRFWSEWQGDSSGPWLWQGLLEERLERPGYAVEAYRKALDRDPGSYEALANVARLELETGRIDESAAHFAACRDRRPEDADAVLGLAGCLLRTGDTPRAAALLREALTLDVAPARWAAALADLGQLALEDGDAARALNLYRQAAALDAGEPRIRQGFAAVLGRLDDREGAAAELAAAARVGDFRRRITAARRRCIGEQENADLRVAVAAILLEAGDPAEAARWLDTAVELDPDHAEARRLRDLCRPGEPAAPSRPDDDAKPQPSSPE
jgi:tetratricopeptide (TPR) repeat protein